MTIQKKNLEAARSRLRALQPKEKNTLTLRDTIQSLEPQLRHAQEMGLSLTDIQQELAEDEIEISASTHGSYLRAIAKSAPRTTRRKPAKPREGGGNANGHENLARVSIPKDEADRLSALLSDNEI